MTSPTFLRQTTTRWTFGIAAGFIGLAFALLGFIYWQTAARARMRIDSVVQRELGHLRAGSAAEDGAKLEAWLANDPHQAHYGGLFASDRTRLAGNLLVFPSKVPSTGKVQTLALSQPGKDGDDDDPEIVRISLAQRPDGTLIAVAYDLDEAEELEATVVHALLLAVLPIIVSSVALGSFLARRAQHRVAAVHRAIDRIMAGNLDERLPSDGTGDELDKTTRAVNRMLDQITALVEEVKGIGDNVAHEIRTPLARVRAKLERCRDEATTLDEFRSTVDQAITSLDQAFDVAEAVMRIGEISQERRRAKFKPVNLRELIEDAAELFSPVAEDAGIWLTVAIECDGWVLGDRDLLLEAIGNLVDNAIKFSPSGTVVGVRLAGGGVGLRVVVSDCGPGIPIEERARVLLRFHRGAGSSSVSGKGLGLCLVAAIARLHGFELRFASAEPGCIAELCCPYPSNGGASKQSEDLAEAASRSRHWSHNTDEGRNRPLDLTQRV